MLLKGNILRNIFCQFSAATADKSETLLPSFLNSLLLPQSFHLDLSFRCNRKRQLKIPGHGAWGAAISQ